MRLKTKLVIAISLMVVAIVVTLSTIYVAQLVHYVVNEGVNDGDVAVHQIIHLSRDALDKDLNTTRIDPADPRQVNDFIEESLQMDAGVNSLLESLIGYWPILSDAAVVGPDGRAILHSEAAMVGKVVPDRPDLRDLAKARFWEQLRVVNGPIRTYAITIPLERNNQPFGSAQVGISSVFLKNTLQPHLANALGFSFIAILVSLALAAGHAAYASTGSGQATATVQHAYCYAALKF